MAALGEERARRRVGVARRHQHERQRLAAFVLQSLEVGGVELEVGAPREHLGGEGELDPAEAEPLAQPTRHEDERRAAHRRHARRLVLAERRAAELERVARRDRRHVALERVLPVARVAQQPARALDVREQPARDAAVELLQLPRQPREAGRRRAARREVALPGAHELLEEVATDGGGVGRVGRVLRVERRQPRLRALLVLAPLLLRRRGGPAGRGARGAPAARSPRPGGRSAGRH